MPSGIKRIIIMTYQEFRAEMEDLEEQYKLEKHRILCEYVMSWCPYKIGDIVRDHIGFVKIEKISPIIGICNKADICMFGTEYTAKMEPKKTGTKRNIYHSNIEQYENSTKKEK